VWIHPEIVDDDPANRGRCKVSFEIGDEGQVLLIAEQHVGMRSAQRIGVRVEQARAGDRLQVAARRIPRVGGMNGRNRHVRESGDAELRLERHDLDPDLAVRQGKRGAIRAFELRRIAHAGSAPL